MAYPLNPAGTCAASSPGIRYRSRIADREGDLKGRFGQVPEPVGISPSRKGYLGGSFGQVPEPVGISPSRTGVSGGTFWDRSGRSKFWGGREGVFGVTFWGVAGWVQNLPHRVGSKFHKFSHVWVGSEKVTHVGGQVSDMCVMSRTSFRNLCDMWGSCFTSLRCVAKLLTHV